MKIKMTSNRFYYKGVNTRINKFLNYLKLTFNNVDYKITNYNEEYFDIDFYCYKYDLNEEKPEIILDNLYLFIIKPENINPFLDYLQNEYNKIGKSVILKECKELSDGKMLVFYDVVSMNLNKNKQIKNYK